VAEASSLTRLDSCTVQVDPPMTEAMEHLRMPENLMKQLHIVADTTPTGLVLTGEKHSDLRPCSVIKLDYRNFLLGGLPNTKQVWKNWLIDDNGQ